MLDSNKNQFFHFKISVENLQVFFAMLAFIEEKQDANFTYDKSNQNLLSECRKILDFSLLPVESAKKISVITIEINHAIPITKFSTRFQAPIIFPKLIVNRFFIPITGKQDKIYFRGLLTKTRLIESFIIFFKILDFAAILKLIFLMRKRRSIIISTKKVFFKFTDRGRQTEYKYLDADYYKEMSTYKYVFCPKGDFIWTYRFFEAIQVGSIPISKYRTKLISNFLYLQKPKNLGYHELNYFSQKNLAELTKDFHFTSDKNQ